MKYTVKDFTALTHIPFQDFLDQALELFQTIHFYGGSESVVEPIINDDEVIIDFKMTHAFGVAVVAILDVKTKQEDLTVVLQEADFKTI